MTGDKTPHTDFFRMGLFLFIQLFYYLISVNGCTRYKHALNYGIYAQAHNSQASEYSEKQKYNRNVFIGNFFRVLYHHTDNIQRGYEYQRIFKYII